MSIPAAIPEGELLPAMPGQRLARGVLRLMREMDHAALTEVVPARGLRVDVMALTPSGEIWVIECKSCRADFTADHKWQGYLEWCDRFFWAIDCDFPHDLLPEGSGLIVADAYAAEVRRMGPLTKLAPARRSRLIRDFARTGAHRLQTLMDPAAGAPWTGV